MLRFVKKYVTNTRGLVKNASKPRIKRFITPEMEQSQNNFNSFLVCALFLVPFGGLYFVTNTEGAKEKFSRDSQAYLDDKKTHDNLCTSVSSFSTRGPRSYMEDEHFISKETCLFGVYDGHGGKRVSRFAREYLSDFFMTSLDEFAGGNDDSVLSDIQVEKAFASAFEELSNLVLEDRECDLQGSTAVSVFLQPNSIWSANVGDSRAVLCRDGAAVDLTIDHKPNSDSERARVEALGGKVRWHGYLGPDRQPIPGMGAYRINGNLAVSRAIGDRLERPFVSSIPDIKKFKRDEEHDQFIILASDGLWDVMTSQDAVNFATHILSGSVGALREGAEDGEDENGGSVRPASTRLSQWMKGYSGDRGMVRAVIENRKNKMAQYLVEESIRRGTADNVTVVVVWLR